MIFLVVQYLSDNMLLRNIFCYNVFMVIGYCYYRQITRKKVIAALLVAIAILIGILYGADIAFTPMQDHKFPPDYLFLTYDFVVLCMLSLLFSRIKIPENRLVMLWNERGYTLYLYQSIVYFGMFAIYLAVISKIGNHLIEGMICVMLMFVMSTIASYVVYPLEKVIMNFKKR